MMTFDEVLPSLLQVCERHPGFEQVERATVVRDIRGRVRLALRVSSGIVDIASLEKALNNVLNGWFVPPILGPDMSPQIQRLRGIVLTQNNPWQEASWRDPISGPQQPLAGRWHRVERHLSKPGWLDKAKSTLPWPLRQQLPAIVTFYSFKGGVGRTTLLASTAWQLAREGKRVVAVDLDVEAPGLGTLLGSSPQRGLLDVLVDHAATGELVLDEAIAPASGLGEEAVRIDVVPAGHLDANYFEKLSRLDFLGGGLVEPNQSSPVRDGLIALLHALKKRKPPPDYILLDSRAGLHDVAGLSLNDLAHVDVLVGRDSDQGYRGLDLTVRALGVRRNLDDLRCVIVHALAPDDAGSREYQQATEEYRTRSYDAFTRTIYSQLAEDDPELEDETAHHYPRIVRFNPRLIRFSSLLERREEMFSEDFLSVKNRIVELCTPETASDNETHA